MRHMLVARRGRGPREGRQGDNGGDVSAHRAAVEALALDLEEARRLVTGACRSATR